uniref:Uncharacterized protein n=1 Tax=Triticum aestivum TaxID=4565 RepID=A0A3B6ATW3_WHEAT
MAGLRLHWNAVRSTGEHLKWNVRSTGQSGAPSMGALGRSGEWEGLVLDGGSKWFVYVSILFKRRMN